MLQIKPDLKIMMHEKSDIDQYIYKIKKNSDKIELVGFHCKLDSNCNIESTLSIIQNFIQVVQKTQKLKINFLHIRRELRREAVHIRVINASRLWFSGAYRESNGLKSMIRDLIG